jgi:hypothetical protein
MSTSATTNANDLSVYGLNQFGANGNEPPDWSSRKQGIHGNIHGDYDPDSDGYNGDDGGDLIGPTMGMEGTAAGSPVAWWFALGGTLIALKLIAEKNGDASEFKTIRVGASNILIITLSSIVGLTLLKWVFGIYKIPGLSQIVEAV